VHIVKQLSMNRRRRQSPGGRTEYVHVNELGYEVRLKVASRIRVEGHYQQVWSLYMTTQCGL